jgi:hypothetical protein
MRYLLAVLIAVTAVSAAYAQFPPPPPERLGAPPSQAEDPLKKQFATADTNGDGRLTLEEAKIKMPLVAENFEAIDKNKAGSVTLEQVQSFAFEQLMARRPR